MEIPTSIMEVISKIFVIQGSISKNPGGRGIDIISKFYGLSKPKDGKPAYARYLPGMKNAECY